MQITRTRSKYYLLSLLGAMVVALGVLAVAPSAQAQELQPPTLDKECTPNPVQVGQTLTCSFSVTADTNSGASFTFDPDTFPRGIRPISSANESCMVNGQTVTCQVLFIQGPSTAPLPAIFLIVDAIAEQCGTFSNTASITGEFAETPPLGEPELLLPFTAEDTEDITVVGCEEPPVPGQQQQGSPAPITQEGEQESDAGEIDQSFEVS